MRQSWWPSRVPGETRRKPRAARAKKLSPIQPHYITKGEGVELLDRQARKYLNMSGQEFRAKFRSGELTYNDHPEVVRVAMLIPFSED